MLIWIFARPAGLDDFLKDFARIVASDMH